jgi:hypothetical protein
MLKNMKIDEIINICCTFVPKNKIKQDWIKNII